MKARDPYYKKTAALDIGGLSLEFRVSQTLFSSHAVDAGTQLLLRTLHGTGRRFEKVLDLGCGYGPIGVALKALNPGAALHMVDRDALAVGYASQNALLNGIDDALAYPSLGFDDIRDRDFDLVAANIPGKAGEQVIASWLTDAPLFLRDQGQVGVVVVSPLEPFVNEVIDGIRGADVVLRKRRAGHTVLIYAAGIAQDSPPAHVGSFSRGDYDRVEGAFSHGKIEYQMNTVFGLPEFDSLSYQTRFLCTVLQNLDRQPGDLRATPSFRLSPESRSRMIKGGSLQKPDSHPHPNPLPSRERGLRKGLQPGDRVLVLNPGQGHVPVILSKAMTPAHIDMVDRDLLALRCSARNLSLNGYDASKFSIGHRVGIDDDESRWDLIVAEVRDEEGPDVMAMQFRQAAEHLAPGGQMVVAANSATITRLLDVCKKERLGAVQQRKRRRGSSVLVVGRWPYR